MFEIMPPLISILIPIYKAEHTLPRFIESLGFQYLKDAELIFVDDASPDQSCSVLKHFLAKQGLNEISTILRHPENLGVSAARQTALKAAQGKYVIWADPDDFVEAGMYQLLLQEAEASAADMLWEDFYLDQDGQPLQYISQKIQEDSEFFFCALLTQGLHGSTWNKLFRRVFLEEHNIKFPEERVVLCEDLYFVCHVLACRPRLHYVPASHYHYCVLNSSATHCLSLQSIDSLKKIGTLLEKISNTSMEKKALVKWKKGVRLTAAFCDAVPDDFFCDLFPEIRDLRGMPTHLFLKILFALAVNGYRRESRKLLSFAQIFRSSK